MLVKLEWLGYRMMKKVWRYVYLVYFKSAETQQIINITKRRQTELSDLFDRCDDTTGDMRHTLARVAEL